MEMKAGLSTSVLKFLVKDNYVTWSVHVKTYLMAKDLWETVEVTNEPPKQEDDEVAFKAWCEKNFMALNVIQVSCGPDALPIIRQISSAKIAWNTLAGFSLSLFLSLSPSISLSLKKLLLSAAVHQVLKENNYVDWSVRVKTYLMAHDLWEIIEATTEPLRQEDDEATFKAWSTKNFTALHIIQISCGSDAFSEIIEISSAKIAWDTLAKMYLPVLEEDNYVDWSVMVKTYLMAHDLWETVKATTKPPKQEDDEAAFEAWCKKNFMALHIIQISCGSDAFSKIIEISSSKIAWDTFAKMHLPVLEKDNYVDWSVLVKTYLMAHDLWEIVKATTKSPKQEDDEAAFEAWSEKNFTALHIIQISCGSDAFFEIIEISFAKIAWDMLAKMYLPILEEDNYVDWSVQVKTYLKAHDLWKIIEATTEPLRREDDEATFKAWSTKNFKALHIIQISCRSNAFSKIIEISSAKIAWDTLAKMYLPVLEEDNYVDWSVPVKSYLMAHDLWKIVRATTKPPKQEDDEAAFESWSKKNFTALHIIQISCGSDAFSEIIEISFAKTAWDTLAKTYNSGLSLSLNITDARTFCM
jgi:L-fucose mutarotase/ribose pyranase (RbsD/FucU family)